jgi:flavin-dependent dehydrogenase
MAMAIHSAKIASELVLKYFSRELPSREILEERYAKEWKHNFRQRLQAGRWLGALLQQPKLSQMALGILTLFPFLLPLIINKTHGKPITL